MIGERIVPYGGLTFVVIAVLMLATLVLRNPDTHGHAWRTLPPDYDRTPVDTIGDANLQAILNDLPPFSFPAPKVVRVVERADSSVTTGNMMTGMAGMTDSSAGGGNTMAGMAGMMEEVQKITLTQTEFAISPDRVTVKKGVPVELTVVNKGKQVHGLWLPDFAIAEDVRSGKTEVFKFTSEKPGRFRYTCSYNLCGTEEEHARMVGFLTVQ